MTILSLSCARSARPPSCATPSVAAACAASGPPSASSSSSSLPATLLTTFHVAPPTGPSPSPVHAARASSTSRASTRRLRPSPRQATAGRARRAARRTTRRSRDTSSRGMARPLCARRPRVMACRGGWASGRVGVRCCMRARRARRGKVRLVLAHLGCHEAGLGTDAHSLVRPAVDANSRPDPHDWRMTHGWPFRYFGACSPLLSLCCLRQALTTGRLPCPQACTPTPTTSSTRTTRCTRAPRLCVSPAFFLV